MDSLTSDQISQGSPPSCPEVAPGDSLTRFWDKVERSIVEWHDGRDQTLSPAWLRVPGPGLHEKAEAKFRHLPCHVLLACPNGTIWMLRSTDHIFTEAHIIASANFLENHGEEWGDRNAQSTVLCDLLECPVEVLNLALLPTPDAFKVTAVVDALVRAWMATQQADKLDAVAIRREREALESRCRTMLHTGLYQFKSRLDITPFDVLQEAVIPHSTYNYLVPKASRRNRLQFATNWPSLLPHVSGTPARGSIWKQVREDVDLGNSWTNKVAQYFSVSGSAVKALRNVRTKDIEYWQFHIRQLFEALDAIAPEHRPGADAPERWQLLTDHHLATVRLFGKSPAAKTLTGARLRQVMQRVARHQEVPTLSAQEAAQIEGLRASMRGVLELHAEQAVGCALAAPGRAALAANLDKYLAQLSWTKLLSLSKKWASTYAAAVEEQADSIRFVTGQSYWNFVPNGEEFVAPNGLIVRCLSNANQLVSFGNALGNCLARLSHTHYHTACFEGRHLIIGVVDAETHKPLSSAELAIQRPQAKGEQICLTVLQHTGPKNATVSPQQADALGAFLHAFREPRWQDWASHGLRVLAQRRLFSAKQACKVDPAMLVAGRRALERTLDATRVRWLLESHLQGSLT